MKPQEKAKTGKLEGGVRRRGTTWEYRLYLGQCGAQRCVSCNRREWIGVEPLAVCRKCGGALRETREPHIFAKCGFPTKDDAADALAALRCEYKGRPNAAALLKTVTLADFLRSVWLPSVQASGRLKRSTKEGYGRHAERHLIGPASKPFALGLTPLRHLTTDDIVGHYAKLGEGYETEGVLHTKYGRALTDKVKDKATGVTTRQLRRGLVQWQGLSPQTQRHVHAALHSALALAVRRGYLSANPATGAAKEIGDGDAEPRPLPIWSGDELFGFLDSQKETDLGALWHLMAMTGMRRGEAIGLQWSDVDLDGATITVRRTRVPLKGEGRGKAARVITSSTKTKRVRVIELDTQTVEVLRSLRWAAVSPAEVIGASEPGPAWVFIDESGEPLNPNVVSYRWRRAMAACRTRRIPLHGLRHTHASLLLAAGVPITTVSVRLGHANPTTTMNVYSHCLPRAQQAAVQVLESMLAESVS